MLLYNLVAHSYHRANCQIFELNDFKKRAKLSIRAHLGTNLSSRLLVVPSDLREYLELLLLFFNAFGEGLKAVHISPLGKQSSTSPF